MPQSELNHDCVRARRIIRASVVDGDRNRTYRKVLMRRLGSSRVGMRLAIVPLPHTAVVPRIEPERT